MKPNHRIHAAEGQKTSAAFLCVLAAQKLTKREAEEEIMAEKEKGMVEKYWIRKGLDMLIFIQVTEETDRSSLFPQHRKIWRIFSAVIFMMQRR